MTGAGVSFEVVDKVGRITLSRPPHNFFDHAMISRIADLAQACDHDPGVRVCLIMSDQRHFCAGADFAGGNRPDPRPIYESAVRLAAHRKPLIAAVRGAAVGGGLGLALTADIRLGADDCWFQANFVKIGLSPGFGITHTLPRLVGAHRASELLLTGRRVDAAEALAIGLIDQLVPAGALDEAVLTLAGEIARNAPAAIDATRHALAEYAAAFSTAVERELALQRPLFAAPDFDEGTAAMRERRVPNFTDFPGDSRDL